MEDSSCRNDRACDRRCFVRLRAARGPPGPTARTTGARAQPTSPPSPTRASRRCTPGSSSMPSRRRIGRRWKARCAVSPSCAPSGSQRAQERASPGRSDRTPEPARRRDRRSAAPRSRSSPPPPARSTRAWTTRRSTASTCSRALAPSGLVTGARATGGADTTAGANTTDVGPSAARSRCKFASRRRASSHPWTLSAAVREAAGSARRLFLSAVP